MRLSLRTLASTSRRRKQDVQAKVARIRRQLPPDIDEPVIIRFDPNDRPIMSIAMQSAERPHPRTDGPRRRDIVSRGSRPCRAWAA